MSSSSADEILVSVIVPIYNVRDYLGRCLDSVTGQSLEDIEILLVDDGSYDGSEKLCDEWGEKDSRISVLHKENGGLGSARNYGINHSHGKYLAFIDADDWWEYDALRILVDTAQKYDADLVYMNFFWEEKTGRGEYRQRIFCQKTVFDGISNADEHPDLIFSSDARTWSKFYKADLLKKNGLLFPLHPFEDFPINPLVVLLAKRICQVHKPLYHYDYKRIGNITGERKSYSYFPMGLDELKQMLISFGFWEKYEKKYIEYAISLCRSVANGQDIASYDRNKLMNYLNNLYPSEMKKYKYKYGYIGSFAGEQILVKNIFHNNIIANDISDAPENSRVEFDWQVIDLDRLGECDYILVDLLDTKLSIQGQIARIVNILNKNNVIDNVRILELYYSEKHGESTQSTEYFSDFYQIRKQNKILKSAYRSLLEKLSGAKLVRLRSSYMYTYEHTTYGCCPQFYNSRFYKQAFYDLIKGINE